MSIRSSDYVILFFLFFLAVSCMPGETGPVPFQLMSPESTGIHFENTITSNDTVNVQTDAFIYNGAGVAIGDINNNGLPDIFFSGNMVSSRLYLNKGDFEFEDITESAGVSTTRWATGASMADINNNGFLDIYVSVSGPEWTTPDQRTNKLFLNNGDNTFREAASEFKIDDTGFTTHAVFLDYNGSGYLDLFLLGNSPGEFGRGETGMASFGRRTADPNGFDKLYRNNGDGTFTDVSEEAGIVQRLGYGLGVVATDLNGNGWPDIYVSNDITPNDVLYINNGDGTFTDRAADYLRHTSFAGMGIDIADFTNNGRPDIMQTDMMPEPLNERKLISGSTTYSGFMDLRRMGFFPHYNMNTLQMNEGVTKDGDIVFSEIARLSGVAYTDWSWTALFGDYNNNGYKDLLVTNGYPKAVNDFDYLSDMHHARRGGDRETVRKRENEILDNLHAYLVPNNLFINNGDLTFTNKAEDWGLHHSGFSYGAAHADLNNNGRLDLVINNINDKAFIYQNTGYSNGESSNYLQINLIGEYPNLRAIGAKLYLYTGEDMQFLYHTPYRGYMSSMDDRVHFGLASAAKADSLKVIWPDGRNQLLTDIEANQHIEIHQKNAVNDQKHISEDVHLSHHTFEEIESNLSGLDFHHRDEQRSPDFSIQSLLPYQVSRQGPALAVGDVTGNGYDDIYVGGSAGQAGVLYLQHEDGTFSKSAHQQPFESDQIHEDWGALFFDSNGNGLLDLYVASGGYQSSPVSQVLQDRLYINHGNGRFLRDESALPPILTSTKAISAGDFNGNGYTDLFVGGRIMPRDYPKPVRSYILINEGGRFTDQTTDIAPELAEPYGMVTDALWIDYNGSGLNDLVLTGKWMPITFFENSGDKLIDVTNDLGLPPTNGWWYSIAAADFSQNGYPDFVAGNLGLNHTYTTSAESPFGMYAADFSGTRDTDIILTKTIDGNIYPFFGLAMYGRDLNAIAANFNSFKEFSTATTRQVFGASRLNDALYYEANTFASVFIENHGDGKFTLQDLPNRAQISPVKTIIADDITGNGIPDLLMGGNQYNTEPNTPRADAGNGLWLTWENNSFVPIPFAKSGLLTPHDVRNYKLINTPAGMRLLVGNNNNGLQLFNISTNRPQ